MLSLAFALWFLDQSYLSSLADRSLGTNAITMANASMFQNNTALQTLFDPPYHHVSSILPFIHSLYCLGCCTRTASPVFRWVCFLACEVWRSCMSCLCRCKCCMLLSAHDSTLYNNSITELQSTVFSDLVNLSSLYEYSGLIPRKLMFCFFLRSFYYNNISVLPEDIFHPLSLLEDLYELAFIELACLLSSAHWLQVHGRQ